VKARGLDAANAMRRRHAATYRGGLEGRVRLLEERPSTPCVYHLFPVRVPERAAVASRLRAAGVATGVHYPLTLGQQPALRGHTRVSGDLRRAEAWAREELSLPMSPGLTQVEVEYAAQACVTAVDAGAPNGRGHVAA
jgi:dTDP-4-amino-4,6-dideoxygalactose transaminase